MRRTKIVCTLGPATSDVETMKKLIENGRRYRKLEAEYARLMTEESLAALKKTEDEN